MRAIKASEVVKGMRVQVQRVSHNVVMTIEGDVCQATHSANSALVFEDGTSHICDPDHPVTVLAEPEPEWVEGAWYWTRHRGGGEKLTVRKRGKCGWVTAGQAEAATYLVPDEAIDAFGRVLIVDWPGDDVAREIDRSFYSHNGHEHKALTAFADAIRTQGGAR